MLQMEGTVPTPNDPLEGALCLDLLTVRGTLLIATHLRQLILEDGAVWDAWL